MLNLAAYTRVTRLIPLSTSERNDYSPCSVHLASLELSKVISRQFISQHFNLVSPWGGPWWHLCDTLSQNLWESLNVSQCLADKCNVGEAKSGAISAFNKEKGQIILLSSHFPQIAVTKQTDDSGHVIGETGQLAKLMTSQISEWLRGSSSVWRLEGLYL